MAFVKQQDDNTSFQIFAGWKRCGQCGCIPTHNSIRKELFAKLVLVGQKTQQLTVRRVFQEFRRAWSYLSQARVEDLGCLQISLKKCFESLLTFLFYSWVFGMFQTMCSQFFLFFFDDTKSIAGPKLHWAAEQQRQSVGHAVATKTWRWLLLNDIIRGWLTFLSLDCRKRLWTWSWRSKPFRCVPGKSLLRAPGGEVALGLGIAPLRKKMDIYILQGEIVPRRLSAWMQSLGRETLRWVFFFVLILSAVLQDSFHQNEEQFSESRLGISRVVESVWVALMTWFTNQKGHLCW